MEEYFTKEYKDDPFLLFSLEHIITIFILLILIAVTYVGREPLRNNQFINKRIRFSLAVLLLILELSLHFWLTDIGVWDLKHSLPLHLSSVTLFLSAIMLITNSYYIFEVTYFIGLGSQIQAMLTPDLGAYSFPHFRYIHFFLSHGLVVIAIFFMLIVQGYKVTMKSLIKSFVLLNIYVILIFFINKNLGGNYLYIMKKPSNPSILDYLGPWPWYIFSLELLTIVTFIILYLPFFIIGLKRSSDI